jgi:hypothetical protein
MTPPAWKEWSGRLSVWLGRAFLGAAGLLLTASAAYAQEAPGNVPETIVTAPRPTMPAPAQEPMPLPPPSAPTPVPKAEQSGRDQPVTNTIGAPIAASAGIITQADIMNKPYNRTTEFLEQIPGFVATSETNPVDANTMYLRGFLLDHGTDFAFFIDDVPINLPSNSHAQGFSDMNPVIPELVQYVEFAKGPYYAQVGDFSAVGFLNVHYFDSLPAGIFKIEAGKNDWFRGLVANSGDVGPGVLLYAVEANYYNDYNAVPEHVNKFTTMLRYTIKDECDKITFSVWGYNGQGTIAGVIPQRLTQPGIIVYNANLSPTDFIVRDSLTFNTQWEHDWGNDAVTKANAYAYYFSMSLIENPTGYLNDPVNGDQIDQIDRRWVSGFNLAHSWNSCLFGDTVRNTVGAQLRHDVIPSSDVFHTVNDQFLSADTDVNIDDTDIGIYVQQEVKWCDKVRSQVGLRGEIFNIDVNSHQTPLNSGDRTSYKVLPKGSIIFGPWYKTEFYLNGGYSFHSNDAVGVTSTVSALDLVTPLTPTPLLVQARGAEIGVRSQAIENLTTSFTLWQLHLGSELVFADDINTTVPERPSDRYGIEYTNNYRVCDWLSLNADYSWSHGRLLGFDPNTPGQHIPDAITTLFSAGPSITLRNGLFANLRYRYWGPRALIEDESGSSIPTNYFEMAMGYQCLRYTINISFLNLFNNNGKDIEFFFPSAYPQDAVFGPNGVNGANDLHFKPLIPFAMRASFTMRW